MKNFCQHIEKLLAQHDYVVVPNLGGFVVQVQSAQISPDRITAPLATVSFNPLMHHADGMLAIEISRAEQISYRLAMEYIDKQINNIKSQLKSTGSIEFGYLGQFTLDETERLIFTPSANAAFLPHNFQLTDLQVSTIATKKKAKKQSAKTIAMPSRNVFKYSAAAALIFGMLFISPKVSDVRKTDSANLATILVPSQTTHTTAKTAVSADTKSSTDSVITEAKPVTVEKQEEKVANDSTAKAPVSFHVVVASLQTRETAEKFCKELAADNFSQAKVIGTTKPYRIAIQSFKNKEEALRFMENLRKTDDRFESAWVSCK